MHMYSILIRFMIRYAYKVYIFCSHFICVMFHKIPTVKLCNLSQCSFLSKKSSVTESWQWYQGCIIYFAKFKIYKPLKVILSSVYGQDNSTMMSKTTYTSPNLQI